MGQPVYEERIAKVISYIEEYCTGPIRLEDLALMSNFSKYHFSRIFAASTGIPPMAFVTRMRLQKAVRYLLETDETVLEVSSQCGFESITAFNAAFKKHYQKTPRDIRKQYGKILPPSRNNQEEFQLPLDYDKSSGNYFMRRIWDMNITVKELPPQAVAYVRHVGSYLETHYAWKKLGKWASSRGISPADEFFIGISLDDPGAADEFACRYDACVTLPHGFVKEEGSEVEFKVLPGGLYALYKFYDTIDKLGIAYNSLFSQWLPGSGYDADDRPCLEYCMNNPFEDPESRCKVDLYIPVRAKDMEYRQKGVK
ncbi:AraC family transcriptional regulator [Peribacillus sp. SCS-26]|uniref:AraC family transcriptional regulator n=1 Tax=Paraperibacillus marinus TaxID=3115295 RepID=UPI003906B283